MISERVRVWLCSVFVMCETEAHSSSALFVKREAEGVGAIAGLLLGSLFCLLWTAS